MNGTVSDWLVRGSAVAALFAVSACAGARPAPSPSPAKPAQALPPAVAAPAAANDPATPPPPAAMPAGPLTRVGGVVVSADAAGGSITIKDYSGLTRTFRVAGGAALTRGGDDAAVGLDAVAAGDRVRLKVGGGVAASVHVLVQPVQ